MKLLPFLAIAVGAFLFIHFVLIRLGKRELAKKRGRRTTGWSGLLALSGFLRGLALIMALTTAATIFAVLYIDKSGGATVDEVDRSVQSIQALRGMLTGFGTGWGVFTILVLLLGLGIYARKRGRVRLRKAMQLAAERELAAMQERMEQGKLTPLQPTAKMKKVQKELNRLQAPRRAARDTDPTKAAVLDHQIKTLEDTLMNMELARRIQLGEVHQEARLPDPKNAWERLQVFFISRGLFASLSGVARLVFLLGYLLLIPSLLGVYSSITVSGSASATERKLVELEDLRVALSAAEAKADWEQAKAQFGPAEAELSPEDEEVIDQYADAIELAFATSDAWADPFGGVSESLPPARSVFRMASVGVRAQILQRASAVSSRSAQAAPTMSRAEGVDLSPHERVVLEHFEKPERAARPPEAARLRSELKDLAHRNPSFVQKLRSGLASYQQPMTLRGMRGELARATVNTILTSTDTEVGRAMSRLFETNAYSSLSDIATGTNPADSLRRVQRGETLRPATRSRDFAAVQSSLHQEFRDLPDLDALHQRLEQHRPTLDGNYASRPRVERQSRATTRYQDVLARRGRLANPLQGTAGVSSYRDFFPGQARADLVTPRGRVVQQRLAQLLPEAAARSTWIARNMNPTRALARSRSFLRLRGFSRVGGVLIGREPRDDGARLGVTDLEWEDDGAGKVRLTLTTSSGATILTPWHRTNMVYHALTYAADQRATTVTMVTAEPLPELKILLHPALLDTALGQRLIDLDRFVDQFTGKAELRIAASQQVNDQKLLYDWAWAARLLSVEPTIFGPDVEWLLNLRQYAQSIQDNTRTALSEAWQTDIKDDSLLRVKDLYFEQALVDLVVRSQNAESFEEFNERLAAEIDQLPVSQFAGIGSELDKKIAAYNQLVTNYNLVTAYLERETLESMIETLGKEIEVLEKSREKLGNSLAGMFAVPPEFTVWSGVREREFSLDLKDLVWSGEHPNLRFMLQVAFTSEPTFGAAADLEKGETIVDDPWTFPGIADAIESEVYAAVAKPENADEATILKDCDEFTALQRLFRCALDGSLGQEFPLWKLLGLIDIVEPEPEANYVRTPRWNALEGIVESQLQFQMAIGWEMLAESLSEADRVKGQKTVDDVNELLNRATEAIQGIRAAAQVMQEERNAMATGWSDRWETAWREYREFREEWTRSWDEPVSQAESLIRSIEENGDSESLFGAILEVAATLELRQSLEVSEDYRLALEDRPLPAIR